LIKLGILKDSPTFGSPNFLIHSDKGCSTCPLCSKGVLPQAYRHVITSGSEQCLSRSEQEELEQILSSSAQAEAREKRFKTTLCRRWNDSGWCPFEDKCFFAHGGGELRAAGRNPLFKTSPCASFHKEGVCHRGSRCMFAHGPPYLSDPTLELTLDNSTFAEHGRLPVFRAITKGSTRDCDDEERFLSNESIRRAFSMPNTTTAALSRCCHRPSRP